MDSRRVSSARIDSADGTGGRRPGEREEGCLPPPAYLLMHRLTFQCVFKRYDSFIRAIWYRCLESERGLAGSASPSSSSFMADRSLVPSRSDYVRNGTSGPFNMTEASSSFELTRPDRLRESARPRSSFFRNLLLHSDFQAPLKSVLNLNESRKKSTPRSNF